MKKTGEGNGSGRRSGPGALAHLDWWRKSAEFREIMRQAGFRAAARWRAMPRCGAKRRTDGEPCQNPGLEPSGRCRFHGGRTPRGKEWHKVQKRGAASDVAAARDARKLKSKLRASPKRARRLAVMSAEELAAHRKWHATHTPGPPERRVAERERKRQDREARKLMDAARDRKPKANPEAEALQRQIDEFRKLRDELAPRTIPPATDIFS